MPSLLALASASIGAAVIACLLVFGILALIYWSCGYFGVPPLAHKIIGIICAVIFVIYALSRFGLMPAVSL